MSKNAKNVTYKCPYCDKRFNRQDLVIHVDESHQDEIPEDFTPFRLVFNYVNRKPLSYHGKCTECGGPTPWDENKGRYDRQCEKKACKESYLRKFEDNMVKTRGVTRISATQDGQLDMLKNRKISGSYKFQDGGVKDYCGKYELKALEFMDKVLNIKSSDILAPGPILEYSYNDKTHMYISDFYYQPYNLIIEVKDGGDNPNKRDMPEYRAKQIAKEQYIIKYTNYNYLRLTNNDFRQLLSIFFDLKMQMVENTGERVIKINESVNPVQEMMNALMSGRMVGVRDSDAYVTNIPQNKVFAGSDNDSDIIGVADGTLTNLIIVDPKDKVLKKESVDPKTIIENSIGLYKIDRNFVSEKLFSYMNKEVDSNFIYETLFNKKLYTNDQICTEGLMSFDYDKYRNIEVQHNAVENYLNQTDFLNESANLELDKIENAIRRMV